VTVGSDTEPLAGLWPLFGLLIQTPTLRLRLPREEDLPALARAARDIAGPGEPRLQMPWMYDDSPAMEPLPPFVRQRNGTACDPPRADAGT